jgi:predicted lysophospholipase L1 biosynthesis ABC-type transport system permease subunit
MLRGRIVEARGVNAEDLKPAENSAWVLRGDRGITYAGTLPAGSRLVAGSWWPADYSGAPLVSLEEKTAKDLGLKLGDTIRVNVLGRNLTARIANLRAVDWESLGSISFWSSHPGRLPVRRTPISPHSHSPTAARRLRKPPSSRRSRTHFPRCPP